MGFLIVNMCRGMLGFILEASFWFGSCDYNLFFIAPQVTEAGKGPGEAAPRAR